MSEQTDLQAYYENLLIKQYHELPRAIATIGALALQAQADGVYKEVRDAFNIDTAVGPQLDLLGSWVGALRKPDSTTDLEDSELRFLIKLKTVQNASDHSYKSINELLWTFFGDTLEAIDNLDMTMSYQTSLFFSDIMLFAIQTNSIPRPLGVGVILEIALNENGDFGFSFNNGDNNGGLPIYDPQVNGFGFSADDALVTDEPQTSVSNSTVQAKWEILSVTGVWLASDPGHTGTNYYSGGSVIDQVINLGTPLPGPNTAVIITYMAHQGGTFLYIVH